MGHFGEFSDHTFLAYEEMHACLSSDWLNVEDELAAYRTLKAWLEKSGQVDEEQMRKLISHIRFENITPRKIIRKWAKTLPEMDSRRLVQDI